jgi:hypothetical protein
VNEKDCTIFFFIDNAGRWKAFEIVENINDTVFLMRCLEYKVNGCEVGISNSLDFMYIQRR